MGYDPDSERLAIATVVAELERLCRLDESVLRFGTVCIAQKVDLEKRQAAQEVDLKKIQTYFSLAGAPAPLATGDGAGDRDHA